MNPLNGSPDIIIIIINNNKDNNNNNSNRVVKCLKFYVIITRLKRFTKFYLFV